MWRRYDAPAAVVSLYVEPAIGALGPARPGELLHLEPRTLEAGAPAELILFDWQPGKAFALTATIIAGRVFQG